MTINNKYLKRSKISEAKLREFIRYFSLDLDAHKITFLTGLNRNTVNRYIRFWSGKESPNFANNHLLFREKSKLMNHTSGPIASKENVGVALMVKHLFLVFSKEAARCLHRDCFRLRPQNLAGHHSRQSRTRKHHSLWFLARLQRPCWFGIQKTLSCTSWQEWIC